jgi:hypothetical protein
MTEEVENAKDEVEKMCFDTGNHRYSLNIRGFLLLFYCELYTDITAGKKARVREVLKNPIIKGLAPFLLYCEDFQKMGFDVVRTLEQVSDGLRDYILDPEVGKDLLLLRSTEKYAYQVSKHFYLYENFGFLADRNISSRKYRQLDITNKLSQYRLKMWNIQKELLSKELVVVEQRIKSEMT